MPLVRRTVLALPALLATPALAQGTDPRLGERGIGKPDAPVTVTEFFSLTCSHCAAFHRDIFPKVKAELVDKGAIRMVWRDFPLDQLALAAACVARNLPPERYEGFIGALLSNQDRWAFTRGDPREELAKMAALAGMSRAKYDEAIGDEALKRAILAERLTAEKQYNVSATPSFSFKGRGAPVNQSGNMAFERFQQLVEEAKRG
ncbi:thioredoxin domain-containing protein [Belnapia sp. T6]|uniref:Thioredoxin domain-containing protein n=1 Tax=Belnapia mucosa TaxID=2804532 RepID=A0ABS1V3V9_9PROT|nr:thioredoxin domain-containing protein [Belnapia mucosa]MBL6455374.1 thioredoxin domain-containing protein [Belnapia mucosa]